MIREYAAVLLILLGAACCIISMIGVYRFDYVLSRIHAAAVADTLGTLLIFAGVVILKGFGAGSLKIALILLFQWITGPVSTHRIGKVEVMSNPDCSAHCRIEDSVTLDDTELPDQYRDVSIEKGKGEGPDGSD